MTGCELNGAVGAYLLRALPDDEAGVFAGHLPECSQCRSACEDLRPVVDTLPLAAPTVGPPPELKDRIMRTVRAEAELLAAAGPEADRPPAPAPRRRRPWALMLRPPVAAAMACALLAIGVAGGVLTARDDEPDRGGTIVARERTLPAQVTLRTAPAARASLRVVGDGSTARLDVRGLPTPPEGRVYQVWLLPERGTQPQPTDALFRPSRDGDAVVDVPGGVRGMQAVLVTDEPDGGSPEPTRDPFLVARV